MDPETRGPGRRTWLHGEGLFDRGSEVIVLHQAGVVEDDAAFAVDQTRVGVVLAP